MKSLNLDQGVGQTLGNCHIEQLLSHGRRSAVYRGRLLDSNRSVALMVFLVPDATSIEMREEFCDRFLQEAPILMKLQHPHLLPFYGYGEWEGFPYLITPYTTKGSLATRIEQQGAWHPADILPLLEQATVGLEYAHSKGQLHGMLSPANLLLRGDESFQVAAIGLSHLFENRGLLPHVEDTKNLGLPGIAAKYIAPEYYQEQTITIRSDIYSLGVILVEALAGSFLPNDISAHEILSRLDQYVPTNFEPVLQQALALDPKQRFRRMSNLFSAYAALITPDIAQERKSRPAQTSQRAQKPQVAPDARVQQEYTEVRRSQQSPQRQQSPQDQRSRQSQTRQEYAEAQQRPREYTEMRQSQQNRQSPQAYYPPYPDSVSPKPSSARPASSSSLFSIPKIKTDVRKGERKKTIRRRQVTAVLAGSVALGIVGIGGLNLVHAFTTQPQAKAVPAANGIGQATQPVNTSVQFLDKSVPDFRQRLLIHLPDGTFVAYKQGCTHTGVLVDYNPKTHLLVCPAHGAIFDPAKNGSVVTGPTTIPLPKVAIHVTGSGAITLA